MVLATNDTVSRVRSILFDNIAKNRGTRALTNELHGEFFNNDREINRNWNRVAISETNNAFSYGYLGTLKSGSWVLGISTPDRCDECGKYFDGKVYPVITPPADLEYGNLAADDPRRKKLEWIWENTVWINKDNFGRSRCPKKRKDPMQAPTPDNLTARDHSELWMPAIPLHVQCCCRYLQIMPEMHYIKNGEMFLRLQNEKEWQRWYGTHIEPIQDKLQSYGLAHGHDKISRKISED